MRYTFSIVLLLAAVVLAACGGGQAAKPASGPDIVAAFKTAGLEAENVGALEAKDYGMAPFVCQGTRFSAPSAGKNAAGRELGGHIFVCDNQDDLKKLQDFYVKAGQATAILASHLYVKGNTLLQLDGQIAKATADKYGAALAAMK